MLSSNERALDGRFCPANQRPSCSSPRKQRPIARAGRRGLWREGGTNRVWICQPPVCVVTRHGESRGDHGPTRWSEMDKSRTEIAEYSHGDLDWT
ncbi:hypothetical protein EYF80_052872 [Liparis tanakae]|uniref:Uncharacterized protein n=1 Tax=Liparis tanakae TaxID=230148 RepID=A0A4Z2F752_9TELE|nr:hypothetical protein EYF80_052872 [Liparis tanakae]